jgi:hypothetical protein
MAASGLVSRGAVASGPAPLPQVVSVKIERTQIGRPITNGFLGLATEYRGITAYAGSDPSAINPVFVQLIRNLAPDGLVFRVGGDSTDWTWWPVSGLRRPLGISFALTPAWMATTRALAQATSAHLILGVNLEADSPRIASAEARALIAGVGRSRIQALEIGNEPELYGALPWNRTRGGRPVIGRSPGYGVADWTAEFGAIRRALPSIALAAPATGNFTWLSSAGPFVGANSEVRDVTFHRYPLNRCNSVRGAPTYPTVPNLLAPLATNGLLQGAASAVESAHRLGRSFRVDEVSSVTCGGTRGVSNTFASALWAVNAMFHIAASGVDGVNVQSSPFPGAPNQLFTFSHRGGQWLGSVGPEYYGLLRFARAAPPGSHLLGVSGGGGAVNTWATLTPTGQINLVAVNSSLVRSATIRVTAPAHSGPAGLELLQAASAYATSGVTLGGQSFGATTATGVLAAPVATPAVLPSHGRYGLTLPAASAAMLTIPASG